MTNKRPKTENVIDDDDKKKKNTRPPSSEVSSRIRIPVTWLGIVSKNETKQEEC